MDVSTQRRLVNQRLGLDVAERLGIDTSSIFSNEDLTPGAGPPPGSPSGSTASSTSQMGKLHICVSSERECGVLRTGGSWDG